jgi:hypothetical protein
MTAMNNPDPKLSADPVWVTYDMPDGDPIKVIGYGIYNRTYNFLDVIHFAHTFPQSWLEANGEDSFIIWRRFKRRDDPALDWDVVPARFVRRKLDTLIQFVNRHVWQNSPPFATKRDDQLMISAGLLIDLMTVRTPFNLRTVPPRITQGRPIDKLDVWDLPIVFVPQAEIAGHRGVYRRGDFTIEWTTKNHLIWINPVTGKREAVRV